MPFIVQCPREDCRKFMLLEDHQRGSTVECLVCKRPIKVGGSSAGSRGGAGDAAGGSGSGAAPASAGQRVVSCPRCSTPLRLAANVQAQSIRCPKCNEVFRPQ